MEQAEQYSTGAPESTKSLPILPFRRLMADALMASSLYPALLLAACFMEEDAGFGPVPFVIIGFYLLAALTMAFAAWRMLRGEGALSLRKRCFFVLRSSLLLSAPYLVIYFVAGGSYLPWWVAPVFILFMMPIPVFFLERQKWRRQIAAERTIPVSRPALPRALRGNLFICVLLSLAPAAGMLHVVELVDAAHGGGAGVEEIAFRSGAPVLACLVLTVLIYLLLKLLRCVVKRFPYLRRRGNGIAVSHMVAVAGRRRIARRCGDCIVVAAAPASHPAEHGELSRLVLVAGFPPGLYPAEHHPIGGSGMYVCRG